MTCRPQRLKSYVAFSLRDSTMNIALLYFAFRFRTLTRVDFLKEIEENTV